MPGINFEGLEEMMHRFTCQPRKHRDAKTGQTVIQLTEGKG